ncbi:MAG: flippase-like domain-containing protein [Bacteroidia bacterium]|nr:flippase-like domain-containing protein [Bacteroidia bacterium]
MSGKKIIIIFLKIIVVSISVWMIYRTVSSKDSFTDSVALLNETAGSMEGKGQWILIILLMIANWITEAAKWKFLIQKIYKLSIWQSLYSVLTGVTVSFFTPNRTGEFAGRIMHLPPSYRIKGAVSSIVGSMNQLLITLMCGGLSILYIIKSPLEEEKLLYSVIAGFTIVGIIMMIFAYFNISKIYDWLHSIAWLKRIDAYTEVLSYYSFNDLLRITLFSAVRYITFTAQFILLMHLFGISFGLWKEIITVCMIFLSLSVLPTFAFTEVITRGSVALYFLLPHSASEAPVLAAVFFLWLINLALPSVAGAVSFLRIKIGSE